MKNDTQKSFVPDRYISKPHPFTEYQLATIREIRQLNSGLNKLSDCQLRELYAEWSEETACARWISYSKRSIEYFVEWATVAPCDRMKKVRITQAKA